MADVSVQRAGLWCRRRDLLHAVLLPHSGDMLFLVPSYLGDGSWTPLIRAGVRAQPGDIQEVLLLHGVASYKSFTLEIFF